MLLAGGERNSPRLGFVVARAGERAREPNGIFAITPSALPASSIRWIVGRLEIIRSGQTRLFAAMDGGSSFAFVNQPPVGADLLGSGEPMLVIDELQRWSALLLRNAVVWSRREVSAKRANCRAVILRVSSGHWAENGFISVMTAHSVIGRLLSPIRRNAK